MLGYHASKICHLRLPVILFGNEGHEKRTFLYFDNETRCFGPVVTKCGCCSFPQLCYLLDQSSSCLLPPFQVLPPISSPVIIELEGYPFVISTKLLRSTELISATKSMDYNAKGGLTQFWELLP